jgi:gliding motility-associated-like protein
VNGQPGPLRANGDFLHWYSDSVGGVGSIISPIPSLDAPAHYQYFVSAQVAGCESKRAAIDVRVINCCGSELAVPTAITPNGDGRNDFFSILRGAEGTGVDIHIYNRWGQTVFQGSAADRWDGTQNGLPVPVGTYYYIISLDCRNGNTAKHKGEVTVLR